MSETPVRFLTALGKALSDMVLYRPGHPARSQAVDAVYQRLTDLLREQRRPVFTLLEGAVLYGSRPLPELRSWDWAARLAEAGVSRFEFGAHVGRAELERFLEDVLERTTKRDQQPFTGLADGGGIRYGAVGVQKLDDDERAEQIQSATIGLSLGAEADAVRWINREVDDGRTIPMAEAAAVVASLAVAMHAERRSLLPLLKLRQYDEYTTTHALNVAVLSMGLAEWLGVAGSSVRQLGLAGLLHDIGKVKVPKEILNKAGRFTDEERAIMNTHPAHGARILFETAPDLELPSVVAYEHHIMNNGGGYPALRYRRARHEASKLVHVCDVYDALRTRRPYRDAWPAAKVLAYIDERTGTEFDADAARAFLQMMRVWDEVALGEQAEVGAGV
jgi:putative nucleotidyltransferase with HDIG domain